MNTTTMTGGAAAGPEPRTAVAAELLGLRDVCAMLGGCSARHVYRLADSGRLPRPIKLGALLRWRRAELREWLDGGCHPVRTARGAAQ